MAKRKAYPLRIDPKLYDALEKWAEDELRNVNAQIEILLKDAVKKAGRWKKDEEWGTRSEKVYIHSRLYVRISAFK